MTTVLPTYQPLQEQPAGLAQVLQKGRVPQPPLWVPAGEEVESAWGSPSPPAPQPNPLPTQL